MSYSQFLTSLFADGRVTVPEIAALTEPEVLAGDVVIAEYEGYHRLEMAGSAPPLDVAAGRWAGTCFFRACQFLVYRDVDAEAIQEELGVPYREPKSPAVHYSVDLVFRFLPDAIRLASATAENDPLVGQLRTWAQQWPLSSVGMSGLENVEISEFEDDPSLMLLYADRLISAQDKQRLMHRRTRDQIRGALGMFPELAPEINQALVQYDQAEREHPGE